MILNDVQINDYHENGFLVIENMFGRDRILDLKKKILQFDKYKNLSNVICEEGEIRSVFAPHEIFKEFEDLYKDQKLIYACSRLLGDEFYLYQYKVNLKKPFIGKWWEWHQDFPYWKLDDGVEHPNMISVMVYLDDVKSFQGPLMVIPGSHKSGIEMFEDKKDIESGLISSLNSNLKYTVNKEAVKKYADNNGIEILEYQAGTTIFFHPNLFHASTGNLSPYTRDTAVITYNQLKNAPKEGYKRPNFICSRDLKSLTVKGAL